MTCERSSKEMETKLHACVMNLPEIHADLRARRQVQRIARNSHGSRGISKEISRTHIKQVSQNTYELHRRQLTLMVPCFKTL